MRKTDEGPPKRALITAMRTSERGGRTRRRGAGVVFLGLELQIGPHHHGDDSERRQEQRKRSAEEKQCKLIPSKQTSTLVIAGY